MTSLAYLRRPLLATRPRALTWATLVIAAVVLAILVAGPAVATFDEAKYVSVGRNILAGRGPLTAFDLAFVVHPPLWSVLIAAPETWLAIDALTVGRVLSLVAFVALLGLVARETRRIEPSAEIVAVVALATTAYLVDHARSARLDVPEALATIAYIVVARRSITRSRWQTAVLAGLLFAVGFLIKEAITVFAAAPFIAAIAERRRAGPILRSLGIVVATAAVATSWWFAWYADHMDRVYLAPLPAPLLPVVGIGVLAFAVVAFAAGVIADRRGLPAGAVSSADAGGSLSGEAEWSKRHVGAAFLIALAWAAAFAVLFARSDVLAGQPYVRLATIIGYGRAWTLQLLPIAVAAIGLIPAAIALVRGRLAFAWPLIALVCSVPWLLLVVALREPPRNDFAVFALLAIAGGAGWLGGIRALAPERARLVAWALVALAIGAAALSGIQSLGSVRAPLRAVLVVAIVAAVALGVAWWRVRGTSRLQLPSSARAHAALALLAAVAIGLYGVGARVNARGAVHERAVAAITRDLEATVPEGSTVLFGPVEGPLAGLGLGGRYHLRSLSGTIVTYDRSAPLGLLVKRRPLTDEVLALDRHPRQNAYLVLTRAKLAAALAQVQAIAWVTGITTDLEPAVGVFDKTAGVTLERDETIAGTTPLRFRVYRVDPAAVRLPTSGIVATDRAIAALAEDTRNDRDLATSWLARLVPWPAPGPGLARLRQNVAGQSALPSHARRVAIHVESRSL